MSSHREQVGSNVTGCVAIEMQEIPKTPKPKTKINSGNDKSENVITVRGTSKFEKKFLDKQVLEWASYYINYSKLRVCSFLT